MIFALSGGLSDAKMKTAVEALLPGNYRIASLSLAMTE